MVFAADVVRDVPCHRYQRNKDDIRTRFHNADDSISGVTTANRKNPKRIREQRHDGMLLEQRKRAGERKFAEADQQDL